ncbi:DUF6236 family protein [Nonomuraea sp. NPDC023979]|uniref:DUF6236 family protein n=1 Tax=Nonomuraea sp. NPDC023979 TaxID=3154796 RepID=UPI0033C24C4D
MRRIGLYYPYIHFRDDRWLKAAALYWPQMARVVPPGYQLRDSEVARTLADGLDFLVDVGPDPAAAAVSSLFQQVLAEYADRLRGLYRALPERRLSHSAESILPVLLANERLYPPALIETLEQPGNNENNTPEPFDPFRQLPLTGILLDEVEPELRYSFIQAGLAFEAGREEGSPRRWLAVHPQLAWVYKCALTREIARQNLLQPTTDQVVTQSVDHEWTADRIADALLLPLNESVDRRAHELSNRLAFLALEIAVPSNLDNVPTKKIVALRKRYGADFDAFGESVTTTVAELADTLAEVEEPRILDAYLRQEVERKFKRPLEELRKAMRGVGVDSVYGALNVKFELPASVAALSGGIAAGEPVLASVGAAAFGLIGIVRAARHDRAQKLAPSPESYLLHLGKLAPESLLSRVAGGSRRAAGH